ncbi:MAG: GumC family protein [Albimonas sp.]|uniref:GumC family protein n=1 Tax=Albimonas sp. TaxID=1872425 RepID=UPI0040566835|tara:strand:+ start:128 stop:1741 length:1614 start_codon:yes stop_codon:yes gene_type:complete
MLNDLDPRYLLSILLRRFPIFLLTAVLIFSGFAAAAVLLPAAYTSRARILVESQQIPTDLVQSTVRSHAAERLRVIQQRLMTRDNLLEIAAQYDVFRGEPDMTPTEIVAAMRDQSRFDSEVLGGGRDGGMAMTFTISFSARDPNVTARVTNEYVTRILENNLKLRTSRAADTYEFFEQESQRLGGELTAIESQMVEFKRANRATLPETLEFRTNQVQRVQQRIQLLDREMADLREQRKTLVELKEDPTALLDKERPLTPSERARDELERELQLRSAVLSETHPEIRALKTRLQAMEKLIAIDVAKQEEAIRNDSSEFIEEKLQETNQQITLIDTQLDQMADEIAELERQESELERSIAETPNTQMALNALQRNYENLQGQYDSARSKLAVSATGEQLELKQQAERFEVIEQAQVPDAPDKPNRLKILLAGFGGGAGAGLGLVFLLEFLNRAIRRPSDIISTLDIQPLAVIPYIYTDAEVRRRSRLRWTIIVLSVATIVAATALVHVYYMPLDLIGAKIVEKTKIDSLMDLVRSRLRL